MFVLESTHNKLLDASLTAHAQHMEDLHKAEQRATDMYYFAAALADEVHKYSGRYDAYEALSKLVAGTITRHHAKNMLQRSEIRGDDV